MLNVDILELWHFGKQMLGASISLHVAKFDFEVCSFPPFLFDLMHRACSVLLGSKRRLDLNSGSEMEELRHFFFNNSSVILWPR